MLIPWVLAVIMPARLLVILCLSLICSGISAQERFALSGYISDKDSGEKLSGATITIEDQNLQLKSNNYGFYAVSLTEGVHEIRFSFTGYRPKIIQLYVQKDTTISVLLESSNTLEEVQVQAGRAPDIHTELAGLSKLSVQEVKQIPVIFGEGDVLKTIQLLPGVLSGGEGSSGFFVRGGTMDQNLILLDEAAVFNASHLFGFFSTFNTDAIQDINLYKGGMPAQYGGRLASVVDVRSRDGNKQDYIWQGGLGLIASRLSFEGPIKKDKGSFLLSGRRTYADLFLKFSPDSNINSSKLYFYDLNAKADFQLNDQNHIFLSGYFGQDLLGYSDRFRFAWGNATGTLRWNHIFNHRLFSNTTLIFSDYKYKVNVGGDQGAFDIAASIRSLNLKQDYQYFTQNKHNMRFGWNLMHHHIQPASIEAEEDAQVQDVLSEGRNGVELSFYLADQWKLSERFSLEYGLRLTSFWALGPGTFHRYDALGEIETTAHYGSNGLAASYWSLEPRLSGIYRLSDQASIKAAYNRNVQNLHMLSNSSAALPIDVWVMSSNNIRPQRVDQGSLGYYRDFLNKTYTLSVEAYYKDMQNQIEVKNGADIQANPTVERDLLYGIGRAYGLEFLFRKEQGDFSGWVSYTLSKSERQFDAINQGAWFNAKQDRTHDLAVVGMYRLNPHITLSSTFVFSTGNAVTFPSGKYYLENKPVWYYTDRNAYRMPNYHRLDLGLSWTPKHNKQFNSTWDFGLYNVYNRKNAYLIDFRSAENQPNKTEAYQMSLFGIIPSITWNFKF